MDFNNDFISKEGKIESEKKENLQGLDHKKRKPWHLEDPDKIIYRWEAEEYVLHEKSKRWYLVGAATIGVIILMALFLKNLLMAITFLLIAVVGFIYLRRDPKKIKIKIRQGGIEVENNFYKFEDLESFWIFHHPNTLDSYISIKRKIKYFTHIQLPIGNNDPKIIRKKLLEFIPEQEQKEEVANILERKLKL